MQTKPFALQIRFQNADSIFAADELQALGEEIEGYITGLLGDSHVQGSDIQLITTDNTVITADELKELIANFTRMAKEQTKIVTSDFTVDLAQWTVYKVRDSVVLTIPEPSADNAGTDFQIKIQTTGRVEIKAVNGLIEDEECRIADDDKYWNFRLFSDGTEWTEM
jgi:hypothetical protein